MEEVAHINENCNVIYVYIIPFITYFPDMEGVAERNYNSNVCICVYYSLDHLFTQTRKVLLT